MHTVNKTKFLHIAGKIILLVAAFGITANASAGANTCKNVDITLENATNDEIKAKKFEYWDEDATTWRTESIFGLDGHQKIEHGKSWTKSNQDLGKIKNDNTQFRVTYQHRVGGNKWESDVKVTTGSFKCEDELKKTVSLNK